MEPTLFTPIRLGDLELPNRIVMAPLTRTYLKIPHGRAPSDFWWEPTGMAAW